MHATPLQVQTFFFLFVLQILPLCSLPHAPLSSSKLPHFFLDLLSFSSLFNEDPIFSTDLLKSIGEYLKDLEREKGQIEDKFERKMREIQIIIQKLKNETERFGYEIKHEVKMIYQLDDEIVENDRQLKTLEKAKKQIIEMKINESGLYHAKLKEKTGFSGDYEELHGALLESFERISELLQRNVKNKQELAERRMTLGRIKGKRKTIKNTELMNFLLMNEPFLAVAINTDLADSGAVEKIVRKLKEMLLGLEKMETNIDKDIKTLQESYKKRLETLYKEYEGIAEELKLYETALTTARGNKYLIFNLGMSDMGV